jgi:hypothetical protein
MQFRVPCFVFAFVLLMLTMMPTVFAEHSNTLIAEADVRAPVVRVRVPDSVSFGTVTPGFVSERVKIVVNNTGTTAVEVVPQLVDPDQIFSHLMLARRTTEEFKPIGSFKMIIPRPKAVGKSDDDYFYAQLDLRSFNGRLVENLPNHRATIVFWATAA